MMESIQPNRTLVDVDVRETNCGIANGFYIWLRQRDNRRYRYAHAAAERAGRPPGSASPSTVSMTGSEHGSMSALKIGIMSGLYSQLSIKQAEKVLSRSNMSLHD